MTAQAGLLHQSFPCHRRARPHMTPRISACWAAFPRRSQRRRHPRYAGRAISLCQRAADQHADQFPHRHGEWFTEPRRAASPSTRGATILLLILLVSMVALLLCMAVPVIFLCRPDRTGCLRHPPRDLSGPAPGRTAEGLPVPFSSGTFRDRRGLVFIVGVCAVPAVPTAQSSPAFSLGSCPDMVCHVAAQDYPR